MVIVTISRRVHVDAVVTEWPTIFITDAFAEFVTVYSCYDAKGRREQPRVIRFFRSDDYYKTFVSHLDQQKNPLLTRFLQPVDAHSPNTEGNIKIRDHVVPPFVIQKMPDSLQGVARTTGMDVLLGLQVLPLSRVQYAMYPDGGLFASFPGVSV